MTKSTITREESVQAIFDLKVGYRLGFADIEILKRVASIALAAMDSESGCLPLDYLQGHKDGLEWAAQLAEANHPETGDWLYDDPIELAKAIRKGPDMPPSQPALDTKPVAYTDERNLGYIDRGRETAYLWGKQNSEASDVALYRHAQPVPVVPNEIKHRIGGLDWGWEGEFNRGWNACRAAMLHAGNSPAQSDCCPAQNCIHSAQGVDRPVAWHHSAKSKEGNHGTCCFSYASSHDFGPRYEKPQSQPHYLPERLDYDRALHFLSTEPRKVTPETVIGGNSPVIPDGYVMVPVEPTKEILDEFDSIIDYGAEDSVDAWHRLLAAAPQSPGSEPDAVPGKWIPVSERMPEMGEKQRYVLAADFKNNYWPNIPNTQVGVYGDWFDDGNPTWDDGDGEDLHLKEVTHWMQLPAAPQEVSRG
ncbi:DUF551 domain-containing protein [Klebsiella pneumoniae]|nr:DUF551 domain-containing protein [Klebsiella pneumoniae]